MSFSESQEDLSDRFGETEASGPSRGFSTGADTREETVVPLQEKFSARAPSLTISFLRAFCVAGVFTQHWLTNSNWDKNKEGQYVGSHWPKWGGVWPLIILPWLMFLAGFLEAFSR